MNKSYVLALVAACVLCVCVLIYAMRPGKPPAAEPPSPPAQTERTTQRPPSTTPQVADADADKAIPAETPGKPARAVPARAVDVDRRSSTDRTTLRPSQGQQLVHEATGLGQIGGRAPGTIKPPASQPAPTARQRPAGAGVTTVGPATTKPVRKEPRPYTIKPGDTFAAIAIALYGSERHTVSIAQANPLVDPLKLQPGQVIRLPHIAPKPARTPPPAELTDGSVYYVVRAEDTLSRIARQHYRDPRLWRVIYMANREPIGPDPDRIQPGARIIIPPPPTVSAQAR